MGQISLLIAWTWDRKERSVKDDFDFLSLTRRMKLPSTEIGRAVGGVGLMPEIWS